MKSFVSIVLVILIALVFPNGQPALATTITIEVEGVANYFGTGGGLALDGSVSLGSAMTGSCSYDTDTPDQADGEGIGYYSLISISMTIGNYIFTHDPTSYDFPFFKVSTVDPGYRAVSPTPRFDGTITIDGAPQTYDDITWGYTSLELFDLLTSSGEYITTDALPDLYSWPDLSVFNMRREFRLSFYDDAFHSNFDIAGQVTSLAVIPEPATFLLLALGSLALLKERKS
jgi:hypothetical protein